MPHLYFSAAHKSSGKTTLTLGLCAILVERGLTVQAFKKGPDYIDPLWLSQATQRACHNLDFYTMNEQEIKDNVTFYAQNAHLSLIEGNKGLYDGVALDGSDSNAALAKLLQAPVILVLDTQGTTRGVAPLILGYQQFDPKIQIAGIIFNKVGGKRHESKLRAVVEHYTNIPVIGAVQRDNRLVITERHLGLMPSNEDAQAQAKIHQIADIIRSQIDIEQLIEIANNSINFSPINCELYPSNTHKVVKIGIMRDAAFGFYYPGDLIALEAAGAELIPINSLTDQQLPSIDGLFIGGGFPEEKMEALAENTALKQAIRQAIENNMPVYAECGGLMYLARRLIWQDKACEMVGALPFDTIMQTRPQGRGYVNLRETGHNLWGLPSINGQAAEFHAHEFHYSKIINITESLTFAYQVLRGSGVDGQHDGVVYKNTLASYTHLRDVANNHWAQRFVNFVIKVAQT